MNLQNSNKNQIQESLRLMNQCPVCKGKYEPNESNILKEKGSAYLIHITCPHCHNSILATVLTTPIGISSVGMMTDLQAEDVLKLYGKKAINEDELFAFHKLLKADKILN